MFKNRIIKKLSIAIVSLALMAPLAATNLPQPVVNARARTHRVIKHHIHHYYKFAYNRREYRTYLKQLKAFRRYNHNFERKFGYARENRQAQRGMANALANQFSPKLARNRNYARAYVRTMIDMDHTSGRITSGELKSAKSTYRIYQKMGSCATGSAVEQFKMEAHLGTL